MVQPTSRKACHIPRPPGDPRSLHSQLHHHHGSVGTGGRNHDRRSPGDNHPRFDTVPGAGGSHLERGLQGGNGSGQELEDVQLLDSGDPGEASPVCGTHNPEYPPGADHEGGRREEAEFAREKRKTERIKDFSGWSA